MINAVQMSNPNFYGVKNLKSKNVTRKVANLSESPLKGLSERPMRFEEPEKDFFDRNPFLTGSLGSTWYGTIAGYMGYFISMKAGS